jgi:hypothetical protein
MVFWLTLPSLAESFFSTEATPLGSLETCSDWETSDMELKVSKPPKL